MYDIHNHLPCGISDGPPERSVSEAMLDEAARQGVTWINCVCHYAPGLKARLQAIVEDLAPFAAVRGITLHPGFEYDFPYIVEEGFVPESIADGSPFYLVDFRHNEVPEFTDQTVFRLNVEGHRIIVVHPEQLFTPNRIGSLLKLLKLEAVFQLNAVSFLPESGKCVNELSHLLLRAGLGHAIASDAHSVEGIRRIALAEAKTVITNVYGEETAELLFEINPRRLVQGKDPHHIPVKPLSWWERLRYGIRTR